MEHPLFSALPSEDQAYLSGLFARKRFSYQEQRQIIENACDVRMWSKGSISEWIDEGKPDRLLYSDHLKRMKEERSMPTPYHDFIPDERMPDKYKSLFVSSDTLMGRCPCPVEGEKTRCCNLKTLDVVQQCAFGCSYCSIQSFYNSHEIRVVENLDQRLSSLQLEEGTWHIGTGQSSDSLLWGNEYGTLDALAAFARKHPNLIIELKTKSKRTDYLDLDLPANMVPTWSLNAETIIAKEEHLTANLDQRLDAAQRARDRGLLIGFHLHPMVFFDGWEDEYGSLIEKLVSRFQPEELMMFSLGTLTFTKAVLRELRSSQRKTRILDIDLTLTAGKYSYPLETKQKLFGFAYDRFPDSWKQDKPFFYLCMEDPSLWEPTFGYSYPNDRAFEEAMRQSYLASLQKRRQMYEKQA
jgi:spore photoproduct lyase